MLERLESEVGVAEDLRVGLEGNPCAISAGRNIEDFVGVFNDVQLGIHVAAGERDLLNQSVLDDLDFGPLGEGVDAFDTNAMEPAGDLVGVVAEFSAGMQLGEDHFNCRTPVDLRIVMFHRAGRHAASVVGDRT